MPDGVEAHTEFDVALVEGWGARVRMKDEKAERKCVVSQIREQQALESALRRFGSVWFPPPPPPMPNLGNARRPAL